INRETVQKYVGELERKRLLKREMKDGKGRFSHTLYTLFEYPAGAVLPEKPAKAQNLAAAETTENPAPEQVAPPENPAKATEAENHERRKEPQRKKPAAEKTSTNSNSTSNGLQVQLPAASATPPEKPAKEAVSEAYSPEIPAK